MKPHTRPAKREDVFDLAPKLRKQDIDELAASSGMNSEEALLFSFDAGGEVHSIIAQDGEVIGMFGASPTDDPNLGIPWLLASPRLPEVSREFLPQSRKWVIEINKQYPLLLNYVDVRNTVAIRWLKYLGFSFIRLIDDFGVGKQPFYEFVRINDV